MKADPEKPCPFCCGLELNIESASGQFFATCALCRAAGPIRADADAAVVAWNTRAEPAPPEYIRNADGTVTLRCGATVDAEDADRVIAHTWHLNHQRGYIQIVSHIRKRGERRRSLYLARFILGLQHGDPRVVDHIDANTLNNRRSNLRVCDRGSNAQHRSPHRNRPFPKGVHYRYNRWYATIKAFGKRYSLGGYATMLEATIAYNEAAKKLHGEFAALNPLPDAAEMSE